MTRRFAGKLGMYEMEVACEIIHEKTENEGTTNIGIFPHDFIHNEIALIGFCELIHCKWLKHGTYNGEFLLTDNLLKVLYG